jgi:hypothetical protein
MDKDIKITFGMIVLNGEPFVRYTLRSLYPFAHQIIVVEGACPSAASIATPEGHSTDGTLEVLHRFKEREDPEGKLTIVTAGAEGSSDGFWPEKSEMSRAYSTRATGNYLWQVDSDEFYHEGQMSRLLSILERERPDAVSFPMITFWGGLGYVANSFYLVRDNAREYHRLFSWGDGYSYKTHFPPTVVDELGTDVRSKKWLRAYDLERERVYLYHYSLLFPQQVYDKVRYYKERNKNAIDSWEESVYRRLEKPFRVHNVYWHVGWLERFTGEHPSQVRIMMDDITAGRVAAEVRESADVEKLLSSGWYILATRMLRMGARIMARQPVHFAYRMYASLKSRIQSSKSATGKE